MTERDRDRRLVAILRGIMPEAVKHRRHAARSRVDAIQIH